MVDINDSKLVQGFRHCEQHKDVDGMNDLGHPPKALDVMNSLRLWMK